MDNKLRFTKAVMNIIQKLNTTAGLKREKYLSQVRVEFNLAKDEKWVITKLRMMLVKLGVGIELLQIRKSASYKIKKSESGIKEHPIVNILSKTKNAIRIKCQDNIMQNSMKKHVTEKQGASKKKIKSRKQRINLESRQLEKLRKIDFVLDDQANNKPFNKVAFLKTLNLEPQVIYI